MNNIKKNLPIIITIVLIICYVVFQQIEKKNLRENFPAQTVSEQTSNTTALPRKKSDQYINMLIYGITENPQDANYLGAIINDFFEDNILVTEINPYNEAGYYRIVNCADTESFKNARIDLAILNPFQFFCHKLQDPKIRLVAYQDKCFLNNVIVTPNESQIKTIKDLKDSTMSIMGNGISLLLMRGLYPKTPDYEIASTALIKAPFNTLTKDSTKNTNTISLYSLDDGINQLFPTVNIYSDEKFEKKYANYRIIEKKQSELPCNIIAASNDLILKYPSLLKEDFVFFLEINNIKKSLEEYLQTNPSFKIADQEYEDRMLRYIDNFKSQALNSKSVENFEYTPNR